MSAARNKPPVRCHLLRRPRPSSAVLYQTRFFCLTQRFLLLLPRAALFGQLERELGALTASAPYHACARSLTRDLPYRMQPTYHVRVCDYHRAWPQRWPRAILTARNVYLYIQYIYIYISYSQNRARPTLRGRTILLHSRTDGDIHVRHVSMKVPLPRRLRSTVHSLSSFCMVSRECSVCCICIVRKDLVLATCTICQRYCHSVCPSATGQLQRCNRCTLNSAAAIEFTAAEGRRPYSAI